MPVGKINNKLYDIIQYDMIELMIIQMSRFERSLSSYTALFLIGSSPDQFLTEEHPPLTSCDVTVGQLALERVELPAGVEAVWLQNV